MESAISELAHLRIPLQKILDATNNFSDKRIIGKGDFGKVYRGKLDHNGSMIKFAARRLDRKYGNGDVEFWTEVSSLSSFRRNNFIVEMIGFCDEKGEKIIINRHYPKGSLSRYITDPLTLDVDRRLTIAWAVCWGLLDINTKLEGDYIIHRNINSSTILLDEFFCPRLSGFEYSIRHSKERMKQVVHSKAIGTRGYVDPAIEKYEGVNYKSDIYSVGVVLFELLCGKKAFEDNKLLASIAKFHYENGTLKDIIHPDLWNQLNPESFKCLSDAAYSCLQEDPGLRPDTDKLWKQLSKANRLQMKEDDMLEKHPIFENLLDKSSPDMWKVKKWEHLRIELTHIHSPPPSPLKLYAQSYTNPYPKTFKQEIEYYDKDYGSFVEWENKDELPKRRRTVTTKLIVYEEDVFPTEIEALDGCRHPNIQSFLGFYIHGDRMMLFYEYVSHKYLYHILDDVDFTWGKRLKICIDVANGLDYLHNGMENQKIVIHGDLLCEKIELDDIFSAKIVGFEKSVTIHSNQNDSSQQDIVKADKLKREIDVFGFGLVMFEILCGKHHFKVIFEKGKENEGMASLARQWFDEGTIKKKLASAIKEENNENNLFLKKGPNEDSLDTFINITLKCLAESHNQRPEVQVVRKELQKALSFHENHKDPFRMSFDDIKLATRDFDRANCIGGGGFGLVYKGKLAHRNVSEHSTVVVKKLDKSQGQGEKQYYNELQILCEYNHENIIGLVGYSNETNEKLIVYEYASKGSLDNHLNNSSLTWRSRLKICIDVAMGLNFLHEGIEGKGVVIHRDIKTANILLFNDWKAKIGDFGLSLRCTMNEETNFAIDHPCGTMDYVDPMYLKSGILTVKSDVYSFGVALLEILSGRATYKLPKHERQSLLNFMKHEFESKKQNEVVLKAISEEIKPRSLTTFLNIVYRCLSEDREIRPTMRIVLIELKKALEFQDEKDEKNEKDARHKRCVRKIGTVLLKAKDYWCKGWL
ncbi:uncharacterized protein [Rutidosis leptorrhynchoides]|uniref:uncharacterized protein isoform X2 n=1 Tax=Rutidosis leptorrhynchoides TaxID=125765 RepID=UPI003A99BB72